MYNAAINILEVENVTESETNLSNAIIDKEYLIKEIQTDDTELKNFLFSLGCFKGESVTIISVLSENYVINVKDSRYSIDADLAKAIIISRSKHENCVNRQSQ